ncbi:universal stress protein [Pseudohalocynthiibacter aestuariivivens]|nr:universal stress protein [Pseudohalocynthiibacter aestuariivivens]QIE46867.1 universal stress protein [Pseudohalocynthiibacter aestuariivivens]
MAYKTIASVLTDESLMFPALECAIDASRAHDAHLDVLALGVDRSSVGYYYSGASAMMLEQSIGRTEEESRQIEAAARSQLTKSDLRWSCESDVAQLVDLARRVAQRVRFSDLAILPQPYGNERGAELEPVTEACLFDAQVPVMIIPDDAQSVARPKRIAIGWNDSAEAMTAARAALPLLKEAEKVHVVIIDPPAHSASRSDPGGLLSQFLARHGVRVEIDVLSKTLPRVSDVLMRHCADMDADLMVLGAYGHSRFREAVFGGATRDLLEQTTVPLLMAH